jgi:gamma-glutamyl hydrolase
MKTRKNTIQKQQYKIKGRNIRDHAKKGVPITKYNKWKRNTRKKYTKMKKIHKAKIQSLGRESIKDEERLDILQNLKDNVNMVVIGILSIPTRDKYAGATSFIPQSYVQWIESSNMRVVPIQYDLPKQVITNILSQVHGVLFIGGFIEKYNSKDVRFRYYSTLQYIMQYVSVSNMAGNYYPIYSICLNFELMPLVSLTDDFEKVDQMFFNHTSISKYEHIGNSNVIIRNLSTNDNTGGSITNYFTNTEKKKYKSQPCTYNYHKKSFLLNKAYMSALKEFLHVTMETKHNGSSYMAGFQYKSFPYYGFQFHPEKVFNWNVGVEQNSTMLDFSRKLGDFLRVQCGKNMNTFIIHPKIDSNLYIENYDLLGRRNAKSVVDPYALDDVNTSGYMRSYYFGILSNKQKS